MNCSRCGKEMTIKHIRTGTDQNGNPIYHKYALCYHCKIKRDLEKEKQPSPPIKRNKRRNRKKTRTLFLIILFLCILALAAGFFFYQKSRTDKEKEKQNVVQKNHKNVITASDYNDLKLSISMEEAQHTIGTEGNLLTRTSTDNMVTERYQWVSKDEEGTVLLTFQDGKLISISQTGMKEEDTSDISESAIQKLTPGMALEDVNSTLKGKGVRISETILNGVTTSIYGWGQKGNDYLYSAVFLDNVMQYSASVEPKKQVSSSDTASEEETSEEKIEE